MARATFSGAYGHNLQIEIVSGWNKQIVEGNYSIVNVQVRLIANGYAALWGAGGKTLTINVGGASKQVSIDASISQGQTKGIYAEDFQVPHNPDGTKSVYITARLDINQGNYGWGAAGIDVPLANIARASTGSSANGTIGQSITLNISRHSNSFKHSIWVRFGSYDKKIAGDDIDTSYTWTPEMSMCNEIPDASTGHGTLTYITYSGDKEIGRNAQPISLSVPDNIKPTLTGFTLTDTNTAAASVVPGEQAFIQILSNIKVNFGQATGAYGSTITGYYAEIIDKNQSTATQGGTLGVMNYTGNVTIRARVTDSRGRTSNTIEKTVNILEYFAPVLNFGVVRSGTQSSTLTITRNAKVAPLAVDGVQKNQMKLTFKTAKFGSNDYKVDTGSASGIWTTVSSLTNSNANLQGDYAADSSWTVLGVLEDKFTRTEFAVNVATEQVVFSYDKTGVGVSKIRERGALDVEGDTYINGALQYCTAALPVISVNEILEGGPVWVSKDTPSGSWGLLEVFRISNLQYLELTQRFTEFSGCLTWYRHRDYTGKNWTPWVVQGIDAFYPPGSIYQSTNPRNPSTFMGGVWERYGNGKVLVGVDETDADFNAANKQGGSKQHKHTAGSLEAAIGSIDGNTAALGYKASNSNNPINDYTYGISGNNATKPSGKKQNHNTAILGSTGFESSLEPYVTVYRWHRIA
ncbi:hypothetical protein D8895_09710 [Streptococcus sp. BCA20]|nr:hypothetical protein D8895_09710 [Streptococcus sp. BCA20]